MRLIGVLLVLVGCHVEGMVTPDAVATPDGPPRSLGMTVTWNARPALPGMISDKVTVTDAVFQLEHLQLVSDAGADARTTHARLQLEWDGLGGPDADVFPDAPVARYQQILLDMRSDVHPPYAYQILGFWQDDDDVRPFRIADPLVLDVPVPCDVTLPADGSVSVAVRINLRQALNGIDFKNLQSENGVLVLAGPQLASVRDALLHHAFVLDN
jgi:hypothetical protein